MKDNAMQGDGIVRKVETLRLSLYKNKCVHLFDLPINRGAADMLFFTIWVEQGVIF